MDKDQEIKEGLEAQNLLESDVFKNTFINYKNELANYIYLVNYWYL